MTREQLPPTGRMYRALRNQKRPFGTALAEWVENSLGENRGNADNVWITVSDRVIAILDDGQGPAKLGDVVQIGAGAIAGGYDTGRFGWGGSIAQLTYASKAQMWALRADGMTAHDSVDWDRVVDKEEHPAADSTWKRARVPRELKELGHGFLLLMKVHKGKHISSAAVRKHLAREFAAGLRAGKKIYWQEEGTTIEIEPWRPPDLSDVVRSHFIVADGLYVELEAGWSDVLSPAEQGLELEYGPRRLTRIKSPFEGYRGPTIFGWLRLSGDGWLEHFESEKTGIASDVLLSKVEDKVRELLTPLMDELRKVQRETALVEIAGEVADALNRLTQSRSLGKSPGFGDTTTWQARGGTRKPKDKPDPPPERDQSSQRRIYVQGSDALGVRPFVASCPVKGDWQIELNEKVPQIKRALEERPPIKPVTHQLLAMAIAYELVKQEAVVALGLYSEDEFESLLLEAEEDLAPVVYQKLLAAISV